MTQRDLNRAVARATGETVQEIDRRGFVPLTAGLGGDDGAQRLAAWDDFHGTQVGTLPSQQSAADGTF